MTVDSLLSEIRSDLYKYDISGSIDSPSVYRWVELALKRFGGDIAVRAETVVVSKNGQAIMPRDFYDLVEAYKCDPLVCEIPGGEEAKADLQHEFAYVERTERGHRWNSCTECCKEEFEKTITERLYIKNREVRFHYHHPMLLRLGKGMRRNCSSSRCKNATVGQECPWEISINGDIMYCNFDGHIYMRYRATPVDDKGHPVIPETPLGMLEDYIETYVKMKIFENAAANGTVQGAGEMFKVYSQQEMIKLSQAKNECKMMNISINDYRELVERNRNDMLKYERMWPGMNDGYLKLV